MKHNVGNTDRIVRIFLAFGITTLGIYFQSWWALLAFLPLTTALSQFCPVYKIFGLNTCNAKSVQ